MHNLFRNNSPFVVIILFIVTLLMKLQALSNPVLPELLENHLIFTSLVNTLHFGVFTYTILAIIMVFLQALYINHIGERHKLFHKTGYYPAFTYVLLTSLYPAFNYFSEPLLINWFVLGALDVILSFPKTLQPRKQLFNAGFLICVPVLIQFPTIGFLLLLIAGFLFLRSYRHDEIVVSLLGYVTPVYFFIGIVYLVDKIGMLPKMVQIGFDVHKLSESRIYLTGTITGVAILLIAGLFAFQQMSSRMTIYIRRSWLVMFCYLLIGILVTIFAVSAVHAEWILILPPLSFIVAQVFFMEKMKRLSIFMFYFSLALLIFSQITFK